jgi:hypothetical protein
MSTLNLPEPIAACFAADLQYQFRLERGLIASLEITA